MSEVDDIELIYLSIEIIYTLIKKSCITGKFTKAHEVADSELLKITYMFSQGFNFLSDSKLDLAQSMNFEWFSRNSDIKIQRFKKIKKGSKELPSVSYLKVTIDQLDSVELPDNKKKTSK